MVKLVDSVDHRPYAPPETRPVMRQVWSELLFAHWPVSPQSLQPFIPAGLELDTFEGQAWVGVVPFLMSGIRLGLLPTVPYLSAFPELNVRTYVKTGGRAGVLFYSLDAGNPVAVETARRWYYLPYFNAKMTVKVSQAKIEYYSRRTHRQAPPAFFEGSYGPTGPTYTAQPGTLEHWLTERYCLYTTDRRQQIYRGEIHHRQWPLQPAWAELGTNTMALSHNIQLPDTAPLLHFARRLEVVAWPIRKIG